MCVSSLSYPVCKAHAPFYILPYVACSVLPYFCTLFHKWHVFRGGGDTEHEMCVLIFSEGCICDVTERSIANLPERTEEGHEKFWTEQSVARSITSPPECKQQGLPFEAVCSVPTCGRRTVKGSINEEPTDSERHGPTAMLVGRSRVACRGPAGIWHAPLGYRVFTPSKQSLILRYCKFP